jgi:hypothetical protein
VHNFFYFLCALVEVLAFQHLSDPFMWFALNAVFAAIVWALFVHDLRLIRLRAQDSTGPSSSRLYRIVLADQWLNIRFIMPCLFVFTAGSAWAIRAAPDFFLTRNAHLMLVGFQGVTLLVYLATLIRAFTNITPLISATRAEWRDDVEEGI